jgi:hypothetical protein
MAFIGASTASAETLCEENVGHKNTCPESKRVPKGGLVKANTLAGAPAVLLSSIGNEECDSATLAEVIETGNHLPVLVLVHTLTFTNCKGPCKKAKSHTTPFHLEVYADDAVNPLDVFAQPHPKDATKLLPGGLLEECTGFNFNCLYQVKSDLALVGKVEGDTLVFLVGLERSGHSGLCPATAEWHAKYLVALDLVEPLVPIYLALFP